MKKSGKQAILKASGVLIALAVVAVPLASLMMAPHAVEIPQYQQLSLPDQAGAVSLNTEDAEAASAVSTLMSGSVVGADDPIIDLKHAASIMVPY